MKLITLILFILLMNNCYAQSHSNEIEAKLVYSNHQYNNGKNEIICERGITITLLNNTNVDYYVENGMNIGYNLVLTQNNTSKKIIEFNNDYEQIEPSYFDLIMSTGNGLNNLFSKPCELFEYSKNLISNQLIKANLPNSSLSIRKSLGIIYIKSKSVYSVFINLTYCNLMGDFKVYLKSKYPYNDFKDNIVNIKLPEMIKEYYKYSGVINSDTLNIKIK